MLADLIKHYLVAHAHVDPLRLEQPDVKVSELGLDSLGLIEMLFEVEDRYGFQVDEPMRFQTMRFDEMVAAIEADVRAHHGGELPEPAATETAATSG